MALLAIPTLEYPSAPRPQTLRLSPNPTLVFARVLFGGRLT